MNDSARIAADDRDLREMIRHPRGCRLSELPLTAGNLGQDNYTPACATSPPDAPRNPDPPKPQASKPAWQCCPDCGSDDLEQCRFANHPLIGDVDFKRCNECGNELDHC